MTDNPFGDIAETGAERIARERVLARGKRQGYVRTALLFLSICLGVGVGAAVSASLIGWNLGDCLLVFAVAIAGGFLGALIGVFAWMRLQMIEDAAAGSPWARYSTYSILDAILYAIYGAKLDYVFTTFPILVGCVLVQIFGKSAVVTGGAAVGGSLVLGAGLLLARAVSGGAATRSSTH